VDRDHHSDDGPETISPTTEGGFIELEDVSAIEVLTREPIASRVHKVAQLAVNFLKTPSQFNRLLECLHCGDRAEAVEDFCYPWGGRDRPQPVLDLDLCAICSVPISRQESQFQDRSERHHRVSVKPSLGKQHRIVQLGLCFNEREIVTRAKLIERLWHEVADVSKGPYQIMQMCAQFRIVPEQIVRMLQHFLWATP
jgi:hypothetical protein